VLVGCGPLVRAVCHVFVLCPLDSAAAAAKAKTGMEER
jgi:hypothetical protein